MNKVFINVFCPWRNGISTVTVDINKAKILDIQEELFKKNVSYQEMDTLFLIPERTVRLPDEDNVRPGMEYAPAIRSSLEQAGLTDADLMRQQPIKKLKGMLPHYEEDYVHFIAVGSHFPNIMVMDKATNVLTEYDNMASISPITHLIPKGRRLDPSLKIYKVFPQLSRMSAHSLFSPREPFTRREISSITEEDLEELPIRASIAFAYPWDCRAELVHFVFEATSSDGEEEAKEGISKLRPVTRGQFFQDVPSASPSSEGILSMFEKNQRSLNRTMAIGRAHESSIPASLLDVTLCQFRENLANISPTSNDIKCFWELRKFLTPVYKLESIRREKFSKVLVDFGILPDDMRRSFVGTTDYNHDGAIVCRINDVEIVFYVQEIKVEVGCDGADPYYEAIRYYVEYLRPHFTNKLEELNKFKKVNFPVIIVIHFGPYIGVAGGVFTDRPIVEFFGCIPLFVHSTNEREISAGERFVATLRTATADLSKRYPKILEETRPSYQYPFRDFYEMDNRKHHFTYKSIFTDKRVFPVHLEEDPTHKRIVKFTRRYSQLAHTAVIKLGPKLYTVNDVYGWFMVVMEDLSDKFSTLYDLLQRQVEVDKTKIVTALRDLLAELHALGYVHGDIRHVNIMVYISANEEYILKLVDWDWAGPIGVATYPHNLNPEVRRAEGAEPGGIIQAKHDMEMVDLLFGPI